MLRPRFARVRVRPAHRDYWRSQLRSAVWLLIEWPTGEQEPTKYWLSNLSAAITMDELVATAKMRWRIERDYEELKQEFGLGHYEGRGWRGFHHHATLCIAAYGFLLSQRLGNKKARQRPPSSLPEGYRPRGASSRAASCS
jgi:SRSO17 transposase